MDYTSMCHVFGTIKKLSSTKGTQALFCGIWTSDLKVIEFPNFFEIKIWKITIIFILALTMA